MSNLNRLSKEEEEEEERMDEEARTVEHFLNVIEHTLETSHHLEDLLLGGGYDSQEYEEERNLLMQVNNMGLMEGTIAGCVTFASLVGGPYIVKRLRQQQQQQQQRRRRPPKTYTLDPPPTSVAGGSKVGTFLLKAARLGLQVAASLVIAAYTTSYYTDQDEMLSQVASAPLLSGRSVIADEFCESLVSEYHRVHPPEYWNQVQDPYLYYLKVFTTNCQKRRAYEKHIREQMNESTCPDIPISIPRPGVPVDYPVNENDDDDDAYSLLSGESNESSYRHDDDKNAEEWARALVTDREMDDESRRKRT